MAVQVSSQHIPPLMVGALAGAGGIFLLIVVLNRVHAGAGVRVGRDESGRQR